LTEYTNVLDGRTDTARRYRPHLRIAYRAPKTDVVLMLRTRAYRKTVTPGNRRGVCVLYRTPQVAMGVVRQIPREAQRLVPTATGGQGRALASRKCTVCGMSKLHPNHSTVPSIYQDLLHLDSWHQTSYTNDVKL